MKTDFFKIYGAHERQDGLVVLSEKNSAIYVGFGKDNAEDESGYNWRKDYDHIPDVAEIKADIDALINSHTDAKILTGFSWNGKPVYLSTENQFNFKAAYDLAYQTDGANLPAKFKLGEDAEGNPVYHTFTKTEVLADFVMRAFAFINNALKEGWTEKDSIDYSLFVPNENE